MDKQPSLNDMVRFLLCKEDGSKKSQTELASEIGVYQHTISRLKAGEKMPKISYETGKAIEIAYQAKLEGKA